MNLIELAKEKTFSIDSRTLNSGDVFIALKGEKYDGHDYIAEAESRGALAAVVEHEVETNLKLFKVEDSYATMAQLARIKRQEFNPSVVALTGSCGKTTTRTMITNILAGIDETLATENNLNNNIGVPLTLLRLNGKERFAVIEVGANILGEIAYSTKIIEPNVALITNAAPVHLEGFGTLQGVASEKGEIIKGVREGGKAILNADDQYFTYWKELAGGNKVVSFGVEKPADFIAVNISCNDEGLVGFQLKSPLGDTAISLQLQGVHNVKNAIAAAAAAYAVGADLVEIKRGLENVAPFPHRMVNRCGINGSVVIDDSYNANPASMKAALKTLSLHEGSRFFVVGDMAELGEGAQQYHIELAEETKKANVDGVFAIGDLTPLTVEAFGDKAMHFKDKTELLFELKKVLTREAVVLVKGSKINELWKVVDAIT